MSTRTHPTSKIRPVYCPEDRLWYSDDGYDISARSLAVLQDILPGVVIEGYYPKGYIAERAKHKFPPEMTRPLTAYGRATPLSFPNHRHRSPTLEPGQVTAPEPELEDEEATPSVDIDIRDDSIDDEDAPVPDHGVVEFVQVALPERYEPSQEVQEATTDQDRAPTPPRRRHRHRDDPPPTRKALVDWSKWTRDSLFAALVANTVVELADKLGCDRNAVIGKAHRWGIVISEARAQGRTRSE